MEYKGKTFEVDEDGFLAGGLEVWEGRLGGIIGNLSSLNVISGLVGHKAKIEVSIWR